MNKRALPRQLAGCFGVVKFWRGSYNSQVWNVIIGLNSLPTGTGNIDSGAGSAAARFTSDLGFVGIAA